MKKSTLIIICLFLTITVISISISSNGTINNTIYVDDDNLEGPWDGTEKYPYQCIMDALDVAVDGDIIRAYEGIYNESDLRLSCLTINKKISIIGNGSNCTTIGRGIKINTDNVLIQGFSVNGSWIVNSNGSVTIGVKSPAISVLYSNGTIIKKNRLEEGIMGISLHNSYDVNISNNYIVNNLVLGISIQSSNNNIITNNTILNDNYGKEDGILLKNSSNNTIAGNSISRNTDSGLKLNQSHDNNIYNNLIYDNGCEGIWLFFSYYNDFYNNIISDNKRGFELGGYKNKIFNNIIKNNSEFGIHFWATCANKIYENNFINNWADAGFSHIFLKGYSKMYDFFWINNNQLYQNYWDKSRFLPKLIIGNVKIFYDLENMKSFSLPWFEIDWLPAKEPYDITVSDM
jgi:parallel beta-helix repeat protein